MSAAACEGGVAGIMTACPLTAHAAAETLDDLLVDCEFLVHPNPDSVTPYLRRAHSDDAQLAAAVYRASLGRHHNADPELRRWLLALDAVRSQAYELADRLRRGALPLLPWPCWTTASPRPGLLRSIDAGASDLALVPDYPMAMIADADGAVRCWDLSNGMPLMGLDATKSGPITDMACVDDERQSFLITGHANGDVGVWDLILDMPRGRLLPRDQADIGPSSLIWVDCVALNDRIVLRYGRGRLRPDLGGEDVGAAQAAEQVACLPSEAVGEARPVVIRLHGSPCLATSRPGGSLWSLPRAEPIGLTLSALTAPAEARNSVFMVAGDSGTATLEKLRMSVQ
ncbi:hypothetical protein [Streptomyces echinatus]|uniref:hypothetical protein n=1 Tax=Streptomyces echinatus TaxID=67293 RepID=UPI0037B333EC